MSLRGQSCCEGMGLMVAGNGIPESRWVQAPLAPGFKVLSGLRPLGKR